MSIKLGLRILKKKSYHRKLHNLIDQKKKMFEKLKQPYFPDIFQILLFFLKTNWKMEKVSVILFYFYLLWKFIVFSIVSKENVRKKYLSKVSLKYEKKSFMCEISIKNESSQVYYPIIFIPLCCVVPCWRYNMRILQRNVEN